MNAWTTFKKLFLSSLFLEIITVQTISSVTFGYLFFFLFLHINYNIPWSLIAPPPTPLLFFYISNRGEFVMEVCIKLYQTKSCAIV